MSFFKKIPKKITASIAGLLTVVASHYLKLPEETVLPIVGLIMAYVFGQGMADMGKEAKKIEVAEVKKAA